MSEIVDDLKPSKTNTGPLNIDRVWTIWVDFIPTAEKLAEHWFKLMDEDVYERSNRMATLQAVHVHETPNCIATYRP